MLLNEAAMTDSPSLMTLPEECGLAWVVTAHQHLAPLVAAGSTPRLDVSAVRRITTPAVQLLLALAREAHGMGRPLEIAGESRPFDEAIGNLALQAHFGEWSLRIHG